MPPPDFSTIDDEDRLWAALFDFARAAYGVSSMLYAFTHSKYTVSRTGIMPSIYLRHNYPGDYIATYGGALSLDNSVAAELILEGHSHLFWSDFPARDLSPGQRERIAIDQACGMNTGISFGFRFGANSGFAALCWASRHADPHAFKRLINGNRAEIDRVAQAFQLRMRAVMIASRIRLTPREKEVLSYSAGGMTAKQIGTHLGLSQKTVANTLQRARRSMGAVSTMEAVAKALVYELIL
jgi:LuxR family transcriptional regulator, quorum-sensing system regulator SdiA